MRASAPLRRATEDGGPVRVRAHLESAEIEENYYFQEQISANPSVWERDDPDGHIKMVLPYDGHKFFTRQARRDVMRSRETGADPDAEALVGFLAVTGQESTDLGDLLELADRHGSVPIEVKIPAARASGDAGLPLTDDSACVVTYDYRPGLSGRAVPIRVSLEIEESDTTEITEIPDSIAPYHYRRIVRLAEFKPELRLAMRVSLALPRDLAEEACVTVSEAFIRWPTRTSLASLRLQVEDQDSVPRYNPARLGVGGLEWQDIAMKPEDKPAGGDIWEFWSPWMVLSVPTAGDLYHQETLDGEVKVTVDRLLSGTSARLFGATGKLSRQPELKIRSNLSSEFSLTLDDAFRWRTRSSYQQMHFGEVVPAEARIDDIITALKNQGFAVVVIPESEEGAQADTDTSRWWISARRPHGTGRLSMLLCVTGHRYRTRRQRQIHEDASYHTMMDSGDLDIYVYGSLHGDSQTIVREINALRRTLRVQFERLPDRR